MSEPLQRILELVKKQPQYKVDAYLFVQNALAFAQAEMKMKIEQESELDEYESAVPTRESHLTGQQLCEAIRQFATEQFGYMAKVVLNSWGVYSTSDFGEIVYNMIRIKLMKKSKTDRREDFDNVYDFDEAFQQQYQITLPK